MKFLSLPKLSVNQLLCHFTKTHGTEYLLDAALGKGCVHIFRPEKGLRVSVWDCYFFEEIELFNHQSTCKDPDYFSLAYFLDPQRLQSSGEGNPFQQQILWNSLFVSPASDFKLTIAARVRYQCISIQFSKAWLQQAMQTDCNIQQVTERSNQLEKQKMFRIMTEQERNILEDLFLVGKQKHFRSFHVKAAVLQLVCDFLYGMQHEQSAFVDANTSGTLDKVEQWLCEHITKEFTGIKALAQQFSLSKSTLKRHFKKRFGVTIAAYVTDKKMQYARSLMQEKGISQAEASRRVGYRSTKNFKEVPRKYVRSVSTEQKECTENISCL